MTTIAAMHIPGFGTVIGGDSRMTGAGVKLDNCPKWTFGDRYGIGFCGAYRGLNLVQQNIKELTSDLSGPAEFVERIRQVFADNGFNPGSDDGDGGGESYPIGVLLVTATNVWEIDSDFAIIPIPDGRMWGKGSGGLFASAAGYVLREMDDHVERMRLSILTALEFDVLSGGDVFLAVIKPPVIEEHPPAAPKRVRVRNRSRRVTQENDSRITMH